MACVRGNHNNVDNNDDDVHGDFIMVDNRTHNRRRLCTRLENKVLSPLSLPTASCERMYCTCHGLPNSEWAYPIPRVLAAFVVAYLASRIVQVSASWA